MRAVAALELGNEALSFSARFSGASQSIYIPVEAIIAIYAQETGQGMMLPPDDPQSEQNAHTESLEQHELESDQEQADDEPPKPPIPPKSGHLRIVK